MTKELWAILKDYREQLKAAKTIQDRETRIKTLLSLMYVVGGAKRVVSVAGNMNHYEEFQYVYDDILAAIKKHYEGEGK